MNVPNKFKLFATEIKVVFDNKRCNDLEIYGYCEYGRSLITLSTTQGTEKLSHDKIKDTFYHEKVHMILDHMNKSDLSKNEEFVDVFAKLLRQSDETAEFGLDKMSVDD